MIQLIPRIRDSHNRFSLVQHFPERSLGFLQELQKEMGDGFNFSFFNPSGRYTIDLGRPVQRELAKLLLVINRVNYDGICAGKICDRSLNGNRSCFRNESLNTVKFIWDLNWDLPPSGKFAFDFLIFANRPKIAPTEAEAE